MTAPVSSTAIVAFAGDADVSVARPHFAEPLRVWRAESSEDLVALSEVFRALFPPASVAGAPKIRAVSLIPELEVARRARSTAACSVSSCRVPT